MRTNWTRSLGRLSKRARENDNVETSRTSQIHNPVDPGPSCRAPLMDPRWNLRGAAPPPHPPRIHPCRLQPPCVPRMEHGARNTEDTHAAHPPGGGRPPGAPAAAAGCPCAPGARAARTRAGATPSPGDAGGRAHGRGCTRCLRAQGISAPVVENAFRRTRAPKSSAPTSWVDGESVSLSLARWPRSS